MERESNQRESSTAAWNRDAVDRWTRLLMLVLTLGTAVYAVLAMGAVRTAEFVVVQVLTAIILVLWVVRSAFGNRHRLLWPPISFPVAVILLLMIVSYARAPVEYVARLELLRVLVYCALFFATIQILHRQEPTRVLAIGLVVLGVVVSFYALAQYLTGSEYVWNHPKPRVYLNRASGPYICPDHLAGLLCMLLPLAGSYAITGRFKIVPRVCFGYAALMMLVGLAVTGSHGGWLAVGCGLCLFFAFILRQRAYRIIGVASLLVILVGAVTFAWHEIKTAERRGESPAIMAGRAPWKHIWPIAWRVWKDHPWLGAGPRGFDLHYRQYREPTPEQQLRPEYAHNDYLNLLADHGLVGACLLAGTIGCFLWGVVFSWRFIARKPGDLNQKKSNKSAFVLGASLGLINLMVFSIYDFNMHIPANAIVAVFLLAMVSGHLRFATDRFWLPQKSYGRPLAVAILGVSLGYLTWQTISLASEQTHLRRARQLAEDPQAQIEALQAAFRVEPRNPETAYAIGENLRLQGWLAPEREKGLAEAALEWYQRVPLLNPFDPYPHLRIGMCLHTLGRTDEAREAFQRAQRLDPNGLFTLAHVGWHYLQLGDYDTARTVFLKVRDLQSEGMEVAEPYLDVIEQRLHTGHNPGML